MHEELTDKPRTLAAGDRARSTINSQRIGTVNAVRENGGYIWTVDGESEPVNATRSALEPLLEEITEEDGNKCKQN